MSQPVFQPGVNIFGFPLTFQVDHAPIREVQRGNHDWQDELTVEHCFVFDDPPAAGRVATQDGKLYVPRGSGVVDNMRFFNDGVWWGVRGGPRFNFDHGLTGEDYGYVEYTIVKGG